MAKQQLSCQAFTGVQGCQVFGKCLSKCISKFTKILGAGKGRYSFLLFFCLFPITNLISSPVTLFQNDPVYAVVLALPNMLTYQLVENSMLLRSMFLFVCLIKPCSLFLFEKKWKLLFSSSGLNVYYCSHNIYHEYPNFFRIKFLFLLFSDNLSAAVS